LKRSKREKQNEKQKPNLSDMAMSIEIRDERSWELTCYQEGLSVVFQNRHKYLSKMCERHEDFYSSQCIIISM
jgi:hypothetical protein